MSEMDMKRFLEEDLGPGDVTTDVFIPLGKGQASLICEEDAVVAGLEEACEIFGLLGVESEILVPDGSHVKSGDKVMTLRGPLGGILTGERTALNFIMRMSGIATMTSSILEKVREIDPDMMIAGTRKTTPGFREFEKKAIALGGGWPHRNGLYDMVMIKDNHIAACGGIGQVLSKLGDVPEGMKVEIEVSSIEDGILAAENGVDIIMADHMSPSETRELRSKVMAIDSRIKIEASGNMTEENIMKYAGCADIVSVGALTHSVRAVHFSLDIERND